MYMTTRSWMSLVMGTFRPEQPELFALELGKITIIIPTFRRRGGYTGLSSVLPSVHPSVLLSTPAVA